METGIISLYLNGVAASTNNVAFTPATLGIISSVQKCDSNLAKIGKFSSNLVGGISQTFTGTLDDVRIYNRALTAGEVKQLYNAGR